LSQSEFRPSRAGLRLRGTAIRPSRRYGEGLGEDVRRAYRRVMALMDKIKKWLGMGKKKA
jgi:hypothetical protein